MHVVVVVVLSSSCPRRRWARCGHIFSNSGCCSSTQSFARSNHQYAFSWVGAVSMCGLYGGIACLVILLIDTQLNNLSATWNSGALTSQKKQYMHISFFPACCYVLGDLWSEDGSFFKDKCWLSRTSSFPLFSQCWHWLHEWNKIFFGCLCSNFCLTLIKSIFGLTHQLNKRIIKRCSIMTWLMEPLKGCVLSFSSSSSSLVFHSKRNPLCCRKWPFNNNSYSYEFRRLWFMNTLTALITILILFPTLP